MREIALILCIAALCAIFAGCRSDDNSHNVRCTSYDVEDLKCPAYDVDLSVVVGSTSYEAKIDNDANCDELTGEVTIGGQNRELGINFWASLHVLLIRDIHYSGEVPGEIRYAEVDRVNDALITEFAGLSPITEGSIDASGIVTISLTVDGNEANPNGEEPRRIDLSMRIEPEMVVNTQQSCTDYGE